MLFAAVLGRGSGKRVSDFLPKWGRRGGNTADAFVASLDHMARKSKARKEAK